MMCAFVFDHLDAVQITSGAFTDNPASLAVSRKVGYRENGVVRRERRPGEVATTVELLLTPDAFGPRRASARGERGRGLPALHRAGFGLSRPVWQNQPCVLRARTLSSGAARPIEAPDPVPTW